MNTSVSCVLYKSNHSHWLRRNMETCLAFSYQHPSLITVSWLSVYLHTKTFLQLLFLCSLLNLLCNSVTHSLFTYTSTFCAPCISGPQMLNLFPLIWAWSTLDPHDLHLTILTVFMQQSSLRLFMHGGDTSWPKQSKMEVHRQYLKSCILNIG